MPASHFICPDGQAIPISQCLCDCRKSSRCMFLPTLRAIARAANRRLPVPSVTELLSGTRETYLRKTAEYAIDPMKQLYALHGTAVHSLQEGCADGEVLSEERLYDSITSGQFDLYGKILDDQTLILGDYKVTSSYKLMKVLGYYKVDVPTGETYKSGLKKGQPKFRKEWRTDGVRDIFEWAVQLNYYRMLLEKQGFRVDRMEIQAMCRDFGLRIAAERNITRPLYLIPIPRISDHWLQLYMQTKAALLKEALETKRLPARCRPRECWNGHKCLNYCPVAGLCPHGAALHSANAGQAV